MHYRLFVLTNKENGKTSSEVRDYVRSKLDNDASFCGEGGRFGSPIGDWFMIGGRWSGALTLLKLDQDKLNAFWQEFEDKKLGWTNNSDKKEEDQMVKSALLFKKYFPDFVGEIPVWRGSKVQYCHTGEPDDAQIVTEELWNALEKDYQEKHKSNIPTEPEAEEDGICDLEAEEVTKENVVGKKWIVVIDYHN